MVTLHLLHPFYLELIPSKRFKNISGWQKSSLYLKVAVTKFWKKFLFPVANETWLCEQKSLLDEIRNKGGRELSGDGRCDSPGHNAEYLTYSFLDQELKKS